MKITDEQIIDVYEKFKTYFSENKNVFFEKTQSSIVKDIKSKIINEGKYQWNEASLTDYINSLVSMVRGESFARTIRKFAEKYFIENICQDFDEEYCKKAKKSLELHKEYYGGVIKRQNESSYYSDYFMFLKKEYEKNKKNFPEKFTFGNYRKGDYYIHSSYEGIQLSVLYAGKKSKSFGDETGFVVEFYSDKDECLDKLNKFYCRKQELQTFIGASLVFVKPKETRSGNRCRIYAKILGNIFDEDSWNKFAKFQLETLSKFISAIERFSNVDCEENGKVINITSGLQIKNIILYGPPGTGKTANYRRLIDLIESDQPMKHIFELVRNNNLLESDYSHYEIAKGDGRVSFVTFHQSFSYEDFIEGFRPDENGNISLEDGIFKDLCNRAIENYENSSGEKLIYDDAYLNFWNKFIEGKFTTFNTISGITVEIVDITDRNIKVRSKGGKNVHGVKKSDLKKVVNAYLEGKIHRPSDIKKLDVKKDTMALAGYYYPIAKIIVDSYDFSQTEQEERKNYYLIIDEINRGNISKIFGELITLIEEDKRGELTVTLPYSKEPFTVPENLYIIATMNSTDKSIALIDVALRRRFTFVKMMPNPDLVENEEAKTMMVELNKFITEKLGEDFQIGHSYFMTDDLDFAIDYKIVPLLEEYFFADAEGLREAKRIVGREENR